MANDRAQMIQQVFVFILAGLVFILIISYGYKAISYFMERQEQVVLVDFRTDLEIAVEGVKRDFQSVRKVQLKLPSEYDGVCFFDYSTCDGVVRPVLELPGRSVEVSWAAEACKGGSQNVFIVPRVSESIDLPDVEVVGGFVCVPNVNGVTVRMEGTGRKAKVSAWEQDE
ncbi:hypothetical protein HY489_04140 [Candidatus Woesearchaeota archaeon]|nr:hypothetical protein [Candidatus Woesearchaeota archaeon]